MITQIKYNDVLIGTLESNKTAILATDTKLMRGNIVAINTTKYYDSTIIIEPIGGGTWIKTQDFYTIEQSNDNLIVT